MTITKIRLQEEHPLIAATLARPLPVVDLHLTADAGDNGYLIKDIVGLGPPTLTSIVDGFDAAGIPIMDSVAVNGREIAMKIGFLPGVGQSVLSLRNKLYEYIARAVTISLMDDSLIIGQVGGYISNIDVTHFTNQPEVQITILCEIGYFTAIKDVVVPNASVVNNSSVVNYLEGTAPTGFTFRFVVTANTPSWRIYNHAKGWYAGSVAPTNEFMVSYAMLVGDVVTVNTQIGIRSITLVRSSVTYDIAGYLNPGAVWPKLYSGVNGFNWDLTASWMSLSYFKYTPRSWGV